jgi:hypothetical protein
MYEPYVCNVLFKDEEKSRRFGVSAGNELEVVEAITRAFGKVDVSDIRLATPSERASLRLSAGVVKPLN